MYYQFGFIFISSVVYSKILKVRWLENQNIYSQIQNFYKLMSVGSMLILQDYLFN